MAADILGLGTAVPDHRITQQQAFETAKSYCGGNEKQVRALKHLYDRTTIQTRRTVLKHDCLHDGDARADEGFGRTSLSTAVDHTFDFFPAPTSSDDYGPTTADRMLRYEQEIADLAYRACEAAIANARLVDPAIAMSSFHSLVTVSCTGFYSPGFDIELIDRLGLNRDITRSHIGYMGCHGAMNGLRVADALYQSKSSQGRVLLCAAEICSLHFHYGWSSDNLLANSLFADGAAALVLGNAESGFHNVGFDKIAEVHETAAASWRMAGSASYVVPDSLDAMSWKIKDNGFVMTLSAAVPSLIKEHLYGWLSQWLASLNLEIKDIGAWAIHPGGAKILEAAGKSLELSDIDLRFSRDVLQLSGNMSSPTVLFILENIRESLGCVPTVVLAFGPGLTIEVAYLTPV